MPLHAGVVAAERGVSGTRPLALTWDYAYSHGKWREVRLTAPERGAAVAESPLGHSRPLVVVATAAVAAVAVSGALFWPITDVIAAHDVGPMTGPTRAAALQTARDAARGRLLTLGAGLFVAGALIFTARNASDRRMRGQISAGGRIG
jgi:hypothetical protein